MGKKGGKVRLKQMGGKVPKMPVNPMEALAIPPEEMINLPPPPDRSYQIFWPIRKNINITQTHTHAHTKLFFTIFPHFYFNSFFFLNFKRWNIFNGSK